MLVQVALHLGGGGLELGQGVEALEGGAASSPLRGPSLMMQYTLWALKYWSPRFSALARISTRLPLWNVLR